MENLIISTYKEKYVKKVSSLIPSQEKLSISSQGFDISKKHEIYFSKIDDQSIKWKKQSSDDKYSSATIKIKGPIQKLWV